MESIWSCNLNSRFWNHSRRNINILMERAETSILKEIHRLNPLKAQAPRRMDKISLWLIQDKLPRVKERWQPKDQEGTSTSPFVSFLAFSRSTMIFGKTFWLCNSSGYSKRSSKSAILIFSLRHTNASATEQALSSSSEESSKLFQTQIAETKSARPLRLISTTTF